MDISGPEMAAHFIEEVKVYGEGWRVLPRNTIDEKNQRCHCWLLHNRLK